MIIKESLEVSGRKIRGSIDFTNSKGNLLTLTNILGMDLARSKEFTVNDLLEMEKELRIVIGKMRNSNLITEEF